MKKYTLYIVLGIVYSAGLIVALSYFSPQSTRLSQSAAGTTANIASSETETAETESTENKNTEIKAAEQKDTETEVTETETIEIEDTETEAVETEETETEDTEAKDTETEDTETEDTETEDTENSSEYLNLPAVFNKTSSASSRLNLRSEPSMNAPIVEKCNYGTAVTVLSYVDDNWVLVEYNKQTYYCSRKHLTIKE